MIYILNSISVETLDIENYVSDFLLQFMLRKHTASIYGIFELDLSFVLSVNIIRRYFYFKM